MGSLIFQKPKFNLQGLCHEGIAVLSQFCFKVSQNLLKRHEEDIKQFLEHYP